MCHALRVKLMASVSLLTCIFNFEGCYLPFVTGVAICILNTFANFQKSLQGVSLIHLCKSRGFGSEDAQ